ncbi:MAG: hypothetical protein ACREJQ_00570 [bacterium]
MLEIDIQLSYGAVTRNVVRAVEQSCVAAGLTRHSRGALAKYPGCIHLHYRKGREPGTLEITFWPKQSRLWFKVHPRRRAPWMDFILPRLRASIESRLNSPSVP